MLWTLGLSEVHLEDEKWDKHSKESSDSWWGSILSTRTSMFAWIVSNSPDRHLRRLKLILRLEHSMKKGEGWINTLTPIVTFLLRCNSDVISLLSGTAIKAIAAYIPDCHKTWFEDLYYFGHHHKCIYWEFWNAWWYSVLALVATLSPLLTLWEDITQITLDPSGKFL